MTDLGFWIQFGLGAWAVGILMLICILFANRKQLAASITQGPLKESARAADLTVFAGRVLSHILQFALALISYWLILPRLGIPQPRSAFELAICGFSWLYFVRTLVLTAIMTRKNQFAPVRSFCANGRRTASDEEMMEAQQLERRAYDLVERKEYRQAKPLLEKSLQLFELADTHSEYALVLTRLNDLPKAVAHVQRAIELEPGSAKYWANLCFLYMARSELENALAAIAVADSLDSTYPTVPIYQAEIAARLGRSRCDIDGLLRNARERYNQLETRADGAALKFGDVERYINSASLKAR